MCAATRNLLEVRNLCKTYTQGKWWQQQIQIRALNSVNLVVRAGTTVALVGESGAGKTTLAMCLIGLEQADMGEILFEGTNLCSLSRQGRRSVLKDIQLIFQDSAGALSPRMSAVQIVEEPLRIRGHSRKDRRERALEAMERVGIPTSWQNRRPHELSGGQRQRLAIARALVIQPKLLILDEPLAGLDLSIQGQITNLLLDLQEVHGLSCLYISHNVEIVLRIADEIAVMHSGTVEQRTTQDFIVWTRQSPMPAPRFLEVSGMRRGASVGS